MSLSTLMKPLFFKAPGEPTLLLKTRMRMAKYAATRGWIVPLLTERADLSDKWRHAKNGQNFGYHSYLELDELSRKLLDQIMQRVGPADSILDLGCNVGRELNALWVQGHRRLTGVEIGLEPVQAMARIFPELAAGARILNCSMTEGVRQFGDGEFRLVYAHGSLVSLTARQQFVFDEIARISSRFVITVENEWSWMLFPRDFRKVFEDRGFVQVHSEEYTTPGTTKKAALRVLEKQ
ncbi:MAG: methyltransferase domain-containing protein [Verrucomicrobiae bacterium]|nr:methyltransferase domain-containing protein [Verrucomicrobiae bacterium]